MTGGPGTLSPPLPRSLFAKPLLQLSLAACPGGRGTGADPANRTDARARCREGRAAPDADGGVKGSEEGVEATAPSRREALHVDPRWGAVSVPDSGVPPAASPNRI